MHHFVNRHRQVTVLIRISMLRTNTQDHSHQYTIYLKAKEPSRDHSKHQWTHLSKVNYYTRKLTLCFRRA
uniref:Uncharacterized protein n=1 Tax=Rhizophora mucronata TaxID=61149 RepID=A0A2P2R2B6_RHIMU